MEGLRLELWCTTFRDGTGRGTHKGDQDAEPERQEEWSVSITCYEEIILDKQYGRLC